MKLKSLIVLLLAGIWGVGSWWWYTCKVKGFCGADHNVTQVAAGTAAGAAALSGQAAADKAAADAKAKADADKAAADAQAKLDAAAGKITMETNEAAPDTGTGIDPALMYFPTGSANPQLADSAKAYFEKVATFLKDNASGKVTIVGHTDNQGKADKNKALGLKRAEMIKKMLTDMGAPADRVQASSEGPDKPVADNTTAEGRQKNRRVEVTPAK